MGHARSVKALEQRGRHVNRKVAELELLEVGHVRALGWREMFVRPLLEAVARLVPVEELPVIDARPQLGRGDRYGGEEALIAVGQSRPLPELAGELASVVPFPDRQLGQPPERPGRPESFDQRLPTRHALGPALAIVAEEDLVPALPA